MVRPAPALLCAMACSLAAPALAAPGVALTSNVYVERSGASSRVIEPAARLRPGARVVTVLSWKRTGPGRGFTLTNRLPPALQFAESADDSQQVSVDGGRTWGRLGRLRIDGRMAVPEEVTHIRWRISTPAPQGRIAYSAIVR